MADGHKNNRRKKTPLKIAEKKDDELTLYRREMQSIERHHIFKTCCKNNLPHHKCKVKVWLHLNTSWIENHGFHMCLAP